MASLRIDLNADVAEAFGARRLGDDEPLFDSVTSANVACGVHAGDPTIIAATIKAAVVHGVKIGAHPSYPDPAGFGRQTMHISPQELRYCIIYQIGAVAAVAHALGTKLVHVKPHGALYNDSAKDAVIAQTIAEAIASFDKRLILVGLAGSLSLDAGRAAGLEVAAEAFCDRTYEASGLLRNRAYADAMLREAKDAIAQALDIVTKHAVRTSAGSMLALEAQTLCIHGDNPNAASIASAVRHALAAAGVSVEPLA